MRDWAHSRRLGTPADEAGFVVLRQPPASKLANLFRIDVRDHALGLVTQQLGGRVTEHPPGGWLGPRTPSLREGPGSASVPSGSPDPVAGTGARGAALRSWQAGAVQFTAKICGLVGRATMADPLSGGGAFSSMSARCLHSARDDACGIRPRAMERQLSGWEQTMAKRSPRALRQSGDDNYLALVRAFPLRPIRSEAELDRAIAVIDSLIAREDLDLEQEDYLDVLRNGPETTSRFHTDWGTAR